MSTRTNPVIEFLNQGRMPFVGRSEELERVLRFWRQTLDRETLGALYVEGEAGVGKSRLIEESVARIRSEGGAVIHTRLYPDSSTSFAGLLAESLRVSPVRENLLPSPPDPDLGSVAAALRRISRLRSTLLVIEDIHLLTGLSLSEFSHAIQILGNEHLSLLCAARPVDSSARSLLEPWLIEEMMLAPLDSGAIGEIWSQLFGEPRNSGGLSSLMEATIGNPLAVRSALRGAVRQSMAEGTIDLEKNSSDLSRIFRLGVQRYADGLASHLSDEERSVASSISLLGEIFDRQTAINLLELLGYAEDHISDLLAALRFKGILSVPGIRVRPLLKASSATEPLAFTHSLFHHQLLEETTPEYQALIRLINRRPVFYSTTPFLLVRNAESLPPFPTDLLRGFLAVASELVAGLTDSTDWQLADSVRESAEHLYTFVSEGEKDLAIYQTSMRLSIATRNPRSPEYGAAIDELLETTDAPETDQDAALRIDALRHHYWYRRDSISERDIISSVEEVTRRFPAAKSSGSYINFLLAIAQSVVNSSRREILEWVEKEWAEGNGSESIRRSASYPMEIILAFRTRSPAEFEKKRARMEELYRSSSWSDTQHNFLMLIWSYHALIPRLYLDHADRAERYAHATGAFGNEAHVVVESLACRYMEGESIDELMPEILDTSRLSHLKPVNEDAPDLLPPYCGRLLASVAILRNEESVGRDILEKCGIPPRDFLELPALILLGEPVVRQNDRVHPLYPLVSSLEGPEDLLVKEIDALLDLQPLWMTDLLNLFAVITVVEGHDRLKEHFSAKVHARLIEALDLYADSTRSLFALIRGLIERHGSYLSEAEVQRWSAQADAMERAWSTTSSVTGSIDERLMISMIGEISLLRPREKEGVRVRGGRVKRTLGTLAVDRLVERPLEADELVRIAVEENDPEKSRKSMKVAVHRTRELLGKEAITVRDGRPWLNDDVVRVDLEEALEDLARSEELIGPGELAGAYRSFERFSRVIGDDVLLPELYGPLFEAMRDEVEGRQRETGLRLATALLEQEDGITAEKVARLLLHRMPEDEEIADLLHAALMHQGRLVDAERVRTGEFGQ